MLDETVLVEHARDGDQQAFARLCNEHYSKIIQYLVPRVGRDHADDVAQEIFIRAWQGLPRLRVPILFTRWLRKIAGNCASDYLRRQKATISLEMYTADGDREELSVPGPEEEVVESDLVERALSQIRPIYHDCLILYVKEELSLREVAERLNLKDASVGTYISRAKQELRRVYLELLKEHNSTLTNKKTKIILLKNRKEKANE